MTFESMRIKDVRTVVHYRSSSKGWRTHGRRDHFIGIQLQGSALHKFADKKFVLSRNCMYFFNSREDYEVEVYEACEAFSVHFTTYEDIETESFCVPIENSNEFVALLQKADLLSKTATGDDLALMSTLYKLCGIISNVRQKTYFPRDGRIFAAKDYIDINYRDEDCLNCAISQSGLSSRRFNDLFKQNFDTTPNRYLILKRIEHAKSLLETQSMRVADVAEYCGFSDVYYFSKVFKKETGIVPSHWHG